MGKTPLQKILESAGYVRDMEYHGPNMAYVRFDDTAKKLNAERFFLTLDQTKCFRQYTDIVLTSYELVKTYPDLFGKKHVNSQKDNPENVTIRDVLKYAGFALADCPKKDWMRGGIDEIYSRSELSQVNISEAPSYMFYVRKDTSCWSYSKGYIVHEYSIPSFIKAFPQFFTERYTKSGDDLVSAVLHNAKSYDCAESTGERVVRHGLIFIIKSMAAIYLIFACGVILFWTWPIVQFLFKIITAPLGFFLSDDLYGNSPGIIEYIFGFLAVLWTAGAIIAFFRAIFSK